MIERPRTPRTLASAIDAVIETFSPRWAAERKAWRQVAEYNYRGATHGRTEAPKQMVGSADYELEQGRDRVAMVDRARALERDNAIASALLNRSVENVISTGIAPQARSTSEEWNAKAEALFKAWCENADVRGLASFYEMQALQFRSYLRDGDCGTILIDDGPSRGKLQAFESDQLSSPTAQSPSQTLVDGVELDKVTQRPVAFHIVVNDPNERITSARRYLPTRVRVPAESVVFIARRERLSQTRGLPIWAQAFWLFDQLDGHIEATTIAARMAACVGLVIHQAGAGPGSLNTITGSDGASYKNWSMEPGMIKRLQPGDAVTQIAPQQPSQQFESLVGVMCRLLGLPHGLPLELVTLDFSKTNYSSARAALLQAYRSFRAQQKHFIDHWCRPIWRFLIRTWVEDGLLEDIPDWDAHEWIAPGWAWIDPTKEVQAHMMAVEAGLETLTDIARSSGREFVEIVAQRKRERQILADADIPDIRSTATRDPMTPATTEDVQIKEADGE